MRQVTASDEPRQAELVTDEPPPAPAGGSTLWRQQYRSDDHAAFYADKRNATLARRISNALELRMARRALERIRVVRPFRSVLDCASGTGRFLPVLASFDATVTVLDTSKEMLIQGRRYHSLFAQAPGVIVASADRIPLPDASVDVVFCSRLLHHFQDSEARVNILKEFARVSKLGVVFTFFDAVSYRGWRRAKKKRRPDKQYSRYAITRAQCAHEGTLAGLTPIGMNALFRFHTEITAAAFLTRAGGDLADRAES